MPVPAALPTSVSIPPAHIVRIRLGGHCYASPFLAPSEAKNRASHLVNLCGRRHEGFVDFETADGRSISIRARAISAIEVGPPPVHWRDRAGQLDEPIDYVPTEPEPPQPSPPTPMQRPTPAVFGPRYVPVVDAPQA